MQKPTNAEAARQIPVVVLSELEKELLKKEQPLKASFNGTNAFYHYCEALQGRSNYAVCLHTLAACRRHDTGQQELRPTCYEHIRRGACVAVKMRKAEVAAQKALFYIDRADVEEARRLEEEARMNGSRRGSSSRLAPLRGVRVEESEFRASVSASVTSTPSTADILNADLINSSSLEAAINTSMGAEQ